MKALIDRGFAERIIAGHTQAFGMGEPVPLVFFRGEGQPEIVKNSYELFVSFYTTWQKLVKSGAGTSLRFDLIAGMLEKNLGIRMGGRQALERLKRELTAGQPAVQHHRAEDRRLSVFGSIADIFVNRGSRPDLAKKAEKELVSILSKEFYGQTKKRQEETISRILDAKLETRLPERRTERREHTQPDMEKRESIERRIATVERQVLIQEKTVTELRETLAKQKLPNIGIKKITREVMRQMEREMHLERLRMGR